jgi:hypothetical protein
MDYNDRPDWSCNHPVGTLVMFKNMLEFFRNKRIQVLEVGFETCTSLIGILNILPLSNGSFISFDKDTDKIRSSNILSSNCSNRMRELNDLSELDNLNSRYEFVHIYMSKNIIGMCWDCLKVDGIMCVDNMNTIYEREVSSFLNSHHDEIEILETGFPSMLFVMKKKVMSNNGRSSKMVIEEFFD